MTRDSKWRKYIRNAFLAALALAMLLSVSSANLLGPAAADGVEETGNNEDSQELFDTIEEDPPVEGGATGQELDGEGQASGEERELGEEIEDESGGEESQPEEPGNEESHGAEEVSQEESSVGGESSWPEDGTSTGWEQGDEEEPTEESGPLETELELLDEITPYGVGQPAVRDLGSPADLGDWLHYNGLIFGDMTAYQADAEGAVAVGGTGHFGVSGGYDVGGSYNYSDYTHLGQYTNGDQYPTLLLGGRNLKMGSGNGSSGHHNVFGGPIVMSRELYDLHATLSRQFVLMPVLNANGTESDQYFDWVIAGQDVLDSWFREQYSTVKRASQMYLEANDSSITAAELSQYKSQTGNTFAYIEKADAMAQNPYRNQTLRNRSGEVDENILVINVLTDADVWFSDPWTANALPISAQWAQDYELVIFNFPQAVNVRMTGDPQIISNGLGANKTYPDGHVSEAAADERHAICQRVIYNFPAASQISMSTVYLMGTLLAPDARVEASGGSINGQLICGEFETKGGMELHALRLSRYVEELEPGEEGYLSVEKYAYQDGPTSTALDGAAFVLVEKTGGSERYYAGDGEFASTLADAAVYSPSGGEAAVIRGVPLGTYLLRETKAPDGYALNETDPANNHTYFEQEVAVTDTGAVVQIIRYNEKPLRDVHFAKVAAGDHDTGLAGAVFSLFQEGSGGYTLLRQNLASGPDGALVLEGLEEGRYQLRETAPPEHYKLSGDGVLEFTVQLTNGMLVVAAEGAGGDGSQGSPIPIENEPGVPDNRIEIYKYRYNQDQMADTSTGLAGAGFVLYREEPAGFGQWVPVTHNHDPENPVELRIVTDRSGFYTIQRLEPGRYRLVETQVPPGYYPGNSYPDDTVAGFFPDGYAHEFVVADGAGYQLESIANRPKEIDLELLKLDGAGSGPLSGAAFRLARWEGDSWLTQGTQTTGSSGLLTFTGLGEGRYRLEETQAPGGYRLLDPGDLYLDIAFPDGPDDPVSVIVTWGEGEGAAEVTEKTDSVSVAVDRNSATIRLQVENTPSARDLAIYKIDSDIFQIGVDEDQNRAYQIKYLEGAVFRLQRMEHGLTGNWKDYGEAFSSEPLYQLDDDGEPVRDGEGEPIPVTDEYGNPKTKAVYRGLVYGTYRLIEVEFPEGYRQPENSQPVSLEDGTQGHVAYTFTITQAMAEAGGESEYTISNLSDKPRSDLVIHKVDDGGNPIPYVPFKLWLVTGGAEDWQGTMTLEEVLARFDELTFVKYSNSGGSSSFYTDSAGTLTLSGIEPGVYVLFEHWNENVTAHLKNVLYLLSHETTTAEPNDPSFYYHLTVFRVVAVDEEDTSQGVRIQWVDRNKTWNGEVLFDNAANNLPQEEWVRPGNEGDYRSLTVVNRTLRPVDISLDKVAEKDPDQGLMGAAFTLYEKTNYMGANGDMEAYREVATETSAANGTVLFQGLGAAWRRADGSLVPQGYRVEAGDWIRAEYMIRETAAPPGYKLSDDPIYFRLELNPLSKMLDLYLLDGEGAVTGYLAGYTEPRFDPVTKEVLDQDEWGNPVSAGTFRTDFALADVPNQRAVDFVFRKVGDLSGTPLEGASFALYACGEDHSHSPVAEPEAGCWQLYQMALSGTDGLVTFLPLPTGTYQLAELSAPAGHQLPEGQWRLSVDADLGTIGITAVGEHPPPAFLLAGGERDPEAGYWLLNRAVFPLPLTGGRGILLCTLGGAAFIVAAALPLTKRKGFKKKQIWNIKKRKHKM